MAAVDLELAERITRWGALSMKKTEQPSTHWSTNTIPARCDAAAPAAPPTVQFGSPTDVAGITTMWARLYATDAALIEQRVEEMARSVCDDDPRDADERRADALIAAGQPHRYWPANADNPTAPALRTKGPRQERRGVCRRRREIRRGRYRRGC